MSDFDKITDELKQIRDEVELKIGLGSMDAKQKFEELEGEWKKFSERAEIRKTTEDVDDAIDLLGDELKKGYQRLKDAL